MSPTRPEVAFNHQEDLEFFQLELEQLRRSAMVLEAELTQLEAQVRLGKHSRRKELSGPIAGPGVPPMSDNEEFKMCLPPLTLITFYHLQNEMLEASGMELENSLDQELLALEEGERLLCQDLNSVLQAAAQQSEDHQILLGVKYQLESEIHDYRRLLEGLEQQW